ncbi:MAG TPA: hypothetical protein ENJ46_02325 [Hellea balneolensis]|uniref:Uncharacterized protein n=1 Tax=Hellea balneolensis TaxID=287478 RepID=A0A7C3G4Z8_9PROT|nr:hypothetical protein [Hellea balneolensis]
MSEETDFAKRLHGRFEGILQWSDLDALWKNVYKGQQEWYVYEVGMDVPDAPLAGKKLKTAIEEIDKILRDNHDEDYCGIVYADAPSAPTLIKVFGPKNLGASCGSSGSKVWPRWIISHMVPTAVGVQLDDERKPKWWKNFTFKSTT